MMKLTEVENELDTLREELVCLKEAFAKRVAELESELKAKDFAIASPRKSEPVLHRLTRAIRRKAAGSFLFLLRPLGRIAQTLRARFQWKWFTPARSRNLGFIKLAFLLTLTLAGFVYLKVWEKMYKVRVL